MVGSGEEIFLVQFSYLHSTRAHIIAGLIQLDYSHINVLTFSPLTGGCSEGLDAFIFFLNTREHFVNGVLQLLFKDSEITVQLRLF